MPKEFELPEGFSLENPIPQVTESQALETQPPVVTPSTVEFDLPEGFSLTPTQDPNQEDINLEKQTISDRIKEGDYGDESIGDLFYKFTRGEKAYRDKKLREASRLGKEINYLKGDVNNPVVAVGNAVLATGAGLLKIAEDATGLELNAEQAVANVQKIADNLSTDTKLVGDIVGATVTGGATGVYKGALQIGLQTLGEGEGYLEAGANTFGSILLGKTGEFLINKVGKNISEEALNLMIERNQGRITAEELNRMFPNLPTEDKVLLFAESQKIFRDNIKKAITDSDKAAKLGARLESRKNAIDLFRTSEKQLDNARAKYTDMLNIIEKEVPDLYTPKNLTKEITMLDKIYKTDPSSIGSDVRNILTDLESDLTIREALDIRSNINSMLRKPNIKKSKTATNHLTNIRNSLDSFVNTSAPQFKDLISSTISNYRKTVNEFEFGKLVDKHTRNDYSVDWKALQKEVKKEGLRAGNIDLAIPVLKKFGDTFVNDKALKETIIPGGVSDTGGLLGAYSFVINQLKDVFAPIYDKTRAADLKIQKVLIRAIEKNKDDYLGFVKDVAKDRRIPEQAQQEFNKLFDARASLAKEGSKPLSLPNPESL